MNARTWTPQAGPLLKALAILVGALVLVPAVGFTLGAPPGTDGTMSYFLSRGLWWGGVSAFFYYVFATKESSADGS
ncbi:hypothetical protein [Halostagnicola bangensis]